MTPGGLPLVPRDSGAQPSASLKGVMIEHLVPSSIVLVVRKSSASPPGTALARPKSRSSSRELLSANPNALGRVSQKSIFTPNALGRGGDNSSSHCRSKPGSARKTIPRVNSDYALRCSRQRGLRLYPTVYTGMLTKLRFSSFVSGRSKHRHASNHPQLTEIEFKKPRSSRSSRIAMLPQSHGM